MLPSFEVHRNPNQIQFQRAGSDWAFLGQGQKVSFNTCMGHPFVRQKVECSCIALRKELPCRASFPGEGGPAKRGAMIRP